MQDLESYQRKRTLNLEFAVWFLSLWKVFFFLLIVDYFVGSMLIWNTSWNSIFAIAQPFLVGIAWVCGSLGVVSILMDDS